MTHSQQSKWNSINNSCWRSGSSTPLVERCGGLPAAKVMMLIGVRLSLYYWSTEFLHRSSSLMENVF
jgi:hypothetical protein